MTRREIELSTGTIAYEDSGGDGPVLVLLHGFLMDASLWEGVMADLAADHTVDETVASFWPRNRLDCLCPTNSVEVR